MTRCESDHFIFSIHSFRNRRIFLVVNVGEIIIIGDDPDGIQRLKTHIFKIFQTKDLDPLKYFLGTEVSQSTPGITINQHKFALDILSETCMLDCIPTNTIMDPNVKLISGYGEPLKDSRRYLCLMGRFNYVTVARADITLAVSIVSQLLNAPCKIHWNLIIWILKYIKNAPERVLL